MFLINEDDMSIYITRGDSALFQVTARVSETERYTFKPGDVVRINVFEKKACENVVLSKCFGIEEETDVVTIYLEEKETRIGDVISKPKDYWYEIELNPFSDPQTIVGYDDDGAKIFKLFPEGNVVDNDDITEEDIPIVDRELSLTSTRPVENQAVARKLLNIENAVKNIILTGGGTGGSSTGGSISTGLILIDTETLQYYVLKVVNGKLTMDEYSGEDLGGDTGGEEDITGVLTITQQPQSVTVDEGDSTRLSVVAKTTVPGAVLTYNWQSKKVTDSSWSTTGVTESYIGFAVCDEDENGLMLRCIVSDGVNSLTSDVVMLTVNIKQDSGDVGGGDTGGDVGGGDTGGDNTGGNTGGDGQKILSIISQPQNATIQTGERAFFTVEATGDGLSFQWRQSGDNGSSWDDLNNVMNFVNINDTETSSTARIHSGYGDHYMYVCIVTDAYGNSIESDVVSMTVEGGESEPEEPDVPEVVTYRISRSLSNCTSNKSTVSVNEGDSWTENIVVSAGYTLDSVTVKMGGTNITGSAYSNGVITISKVTGDIEITAKAVQTETLGITSNLTNKSVEADAGADTSFEVKARGYNLSFQWQISEDNGSTWRNLSQTSDYLITNATTSSKLTVKGVTTDDNGDMFKCVITDGYGNSITSRSAKLTATVTDTGGDDTGGGNTGGDTGGSATNPIKITKQPQAKSAYTTQAVTFSIEAEGENLSFQWWTGTSKFSMNKSDATTTTANSSTLTIPAPSGTMKKDKYVKCVVSDDKGNSVTSDVVKLDYL